MAFVRQRMTSPAVTIGGDALPATAAALLEAKRLSAAAVVDTSGDLLGVISTTDLIRDLADGGTARSVASLMSAPALVATPNEALDAAAWRMVAARVHRLVVVEHAKPIGVLSSRDVLAEVKRSKLTTPIRDLMTSPPLTIDIGASIEEAIARLSSAAIHGLVVVDGATPVGVFTHTEALAVRRIPATLRQVPLEEVVSYQTVCLDAATPIHRAAAHAIALNARRLLVADGTRLVGILSCIDLLGALARAPEDPPAATEP